MILQEKTDSIRLPSASRKEAFFYGILEAISQNVPVVVSDIEGTAWAWEYSKCMNYPVEDAHACAESIEEALTKRLEQSNKDGFACRCGIAVWCGRIMEIYQKMLK